MQVVRCLHSQDQNIKLTTATPVEQNTENTQLRFQA